MHKQSAGEVCSKLLTLSKEVGMRRQWTLDQQETGDFPGDSIVHVVLVRTELPNDTSWSRAYPVELVEF